MSGFAQRCGVHDAPRAVACERALQHIAEWRLERVRIGWCDLHGVLRGKTLMPHAVADALHDGLGMVSTLMLKDTSDRTAYPVFEPGALEELPGFGFANNLMMLPDPASLCVLPWAGGTGWMRAQPWHVDGTPVAIDPRRALQQALATLAATGHGLRCGLEVEFHIYRIDDGRLDPAQADWPGEPPAVSMIHPGYNLLAEGWADQADEPLRIVQHTAQGLGLSLRSLEIELGPSQVEAVFDATDALTAADDMVRFRNGVRQALRRAGYHASFVCRPPFPQVMASGWHLHQSLVDLASGRNAMVRDAPAPGSTPGDACHTLSDTGAHYLAGLIEHAAGTAVFCTPTVNGFGRFRPNALAPMAAVWGRDNRGAMLRVIGGAGDPATRVENRIGEPMANPYLYIAAQVHAGLDGLRRRLVPPPATEAPYAGSDRLLPTGLGAALQALTDDAAMVAAFGDPLVRCLQRVKRSELSRHDAAEDKAQWQRREYFSRY
ncbi:glutamine synthetase family protein [Ideonella sp. A 288]|uniref:glutamine synthetase family protein n=1 Tax=Ideonella sp. A 288 TaxID=1962181 RepID=UPI000B4A724A|nr:glutamine synthetase family protein [Ideonella sp. A 288]